MANYFINSFVIGLRGFIFEKGSPNRKELTKIIDTNKLDFDTNQQLQSYPIEIQFM